MTSEQLTTFCQENDIKRVRLIFPHPSGLMLGKIVTVKHLLTHLGDGIQFAEEIHSSDIHGGVQYLPGCVSGVESNMLTYPDLRTLSITPWLPHTAQVMMRLTTMDGKPFVRDCRHLLENAIGKLEEHNLQPRVGVEVECYVFKDEQAATSGWISDRIPNLRDIDPFLQRVAEYAEQMGIEINTTHHETSPGQIEFSLQHKFALKAADDLYYFKELLVETGKEFGYRVSLLARERKEFSPSGCHIHLSLQKDGKNAFVAGGKETQLLQHALGGILKHAPAACAFYLPTINSYKRIDTENWTPINFSWAHDNRFVAFRVTKKNDGSKNVENRIAGMDVNPYTAIAAMLLSAHFGVTEKIEPFPETEGNPYKDEKLTKLPRDLTTSLHILGKDEKFVQAFGDEFIKLFTALKHVEIVDYNRHVTSWEREQYG